MARLYPRLRLLYELCLFLSKMHLEELVVDLDGYNRTMVSIFRSIAGQHQLSTNKCIFGPAAWIAATQQFEVKRRRASGHGSACMAVSPSGYSASNFAGAVGYVHLFVPVLATAWHTATGRSRSLELLPCCWVTRRCRMHIRAALPRCLLAISEN